MKRLMSLSVFTTLLAGATYVGGGEHDVGAAALLSASMPGVGEWYNSGFKGGFPLVECIVGSICPCARMASMVDAADGRKNDDMRFDFWSAPGGEGRADE